MFGLTNFAFHQFAFVNKFYLGAQNPSRGMLVQVCLQALSLDLLLPTRVNPGRQENLPVQRLESPWPDTEPWARVGGTQVPE